MAWELLAMWVIVTAAVIWFIRDEKRVRAEAELKREALSFALAPQYRHVTVEPAADPVMPPRRAGGLTKEQRAFINAFANR